MPLDCLTNMYKTIAKAMYRKKLLKIKDKLESQIILDSIWRDNNILIGWTYENTKYIVLDNTAQIADIGLLVKKYSIPYRNFVFIIIDPFDYNINTIMNTMKYKTNHQEHSIQVFILSLQSQIDINKNQLEIYIDNSKYTCEFYSIDIV